MIYDMIWYDMKWYDIWYDIWYMIWYVMTWYDIIYDMIWYDMIWYDIWYDIVMNVKYKSLCVRFYISILVFSNLYVEMVTVRFHSLPHCETNDHSKLLISVYLSVPHSFDAFNRNSDAISLSQL
jgi:hypothetical protein